MNGTNLLKELVTKPAELFQIRPLDWNLFADQILEIENQSFSPLLRDSPQALRKLIQSRSSVVLGLKSPRSGLLVGYVAGDLLECFEGVPGIATDPHFGLGDTMYMESLAVNQAWQHQGYGTALSRTFLHRARDLNFPRTTAHIAHDSISKMQVSVLGLRSFPNWYGTNRTFDYVEFVPEK